MRPCASAMARSGVGNNVVEAMATGFGGTAVFTHSGTATGAQRIQEHSRTAAERLIALRLSRERATLTCELTTADESDDKAFIAAQRAALSAGAIPGPRLATHADTDDDLDAYDVDDDDVDDDEYYADAFEDA